MPATSRDANISPWAYLPGQFDQRRVGRRLRAADRPGRRKVSIRSSKLLLFDDKVTDAELAKIRHYYINAVESREKNLAVLSDTWSRPSETRGGARWFREMTGFELEPYCKKMGLAMDIDDDLREVVKYFRAEGRDPYETELRILDTYWATIAATTFTTELEGITVENRSSRRNRRFALALYLRASAANWAASTRASAHSGHGDVGARNLKQKGLLDDFMESLG